MIEYHDFSVKIEPKQDDTYPVIILDSPAGQGRGDFKLPFRPEELGHLLVELGRTVRGAPGAPPDAAPVGAGRVPPHQVGDQLFRALISGRVQTLYDRSLGRIEGQHNRGLRIKLHLDPEHPDLAQLASLPWELLYQAQTREFLNLNRLTPIVRYLDVPRPTRPLPFQPPLRVLVVVSSPTGVEPLDLGQERRQIEAAWGQDEAVEVRFLEKATTAALRRALLTETFQVLHYMGHGAFDERTGRGVLLFEDAWGDPDPLTGQALATMLQGVSATRLVFLNACDTARTSRQQGVDPFAGVATALVMGGLPAVVAMQFPISDEAAIAFSQEFYHRLAAGDPVDAAVAEGRMAVYLADTQSLEWGTPVLFMRTPNGRLFDVSHVELATGPPGEIREPEGAVVAEKPTEREVETQRKVLWQRLPVPWLVTGGALALLVVVVAVIAVLNRNGQQLSPAGVVAPPSPTLGATETVLEAPATTPTPLESRPGPTGTPPATSIPTMSEDLGTIVELNRLELGSITGISMRPDGEMLAVTDGQKAEVYNLDTLEPMRVLESQASGVHDIVSWSPDGTRLALAGPDGSVPILDASSGDELRVLPGHEGVVFSVAWSPDGTQLASGGTDSKVRVWAVDSGRELHALEGHGGDVLSVAWTSDGTRLASAGGDSRVRVWDVANGKEIHELAGHQDVVRLVTWSPDDTRLVSGASADGRVRVWDADSGRQLFNVEGAGAGWSPDGKLLAVGGGDGTLRILNADSGLELATLEGHSDLVWFVAWSPDGARLVSGGFDNTIRVWDIASAFPADAAGHITYQHNEGHIYRIQAREGATPEDVSLALDRLASGSEDDDLNISPDGEWLVLNTDRFDPGCVGWSCLALVAGDLSAGEAVRADGELIHSEGISAVASEGNLIVYPAGDGPHTRDLWTVARSGNAWGKPALLTGDSPYDWHERPAISADGGQVVFDCGPEPYGAEGTAICAVGTDGTGFRVIVTPEQGPDGSSQNALHHPDFAPDGGIVFEADWGGIQRIWHLPAGAVEPVRVGAQFESDSTPCVLPDGRIASLWEWPPQIKVMAPDGSSHVVLSTGPDVFGVGIGCGR